MIVAAKTDPYKRDKPPFVPSKFVFVVHYGIPHQVYYHGTHLDTWNQECGDLLSEVVGDLTLTGQGRLADGAYLWEGHIESSVSYEGEHDAWLEADALRLLTKEEWECITKDEIPWDLEAVRACQDWYDQEDKEEQSEYFGTNLSEDLPTLLAMVRRNERKMLDDHTLSLLGSRLHTKLAKDIVCVLVLGESTNCPIVDAKATAIRELALGIMR